MRTAKQINGIYPVIGSLRAKCEYYISLKGRASRDYIAKRVRETRKEMFDIQDKYQRYYGIDPLTKK